MNGNGNGGFRSATPNSRYVSTYRRESRGGELGIWGEFWEGWRV